MKINFKSLVVMFVAVSLIGCGKKVITGCTDATALNYNSTATANNGSCKYTGKVTFWCDTVWSNVQVTINGLQNIHGTITKYYLTSTPSCDSEGCVTFTLRIGTYTYTAFDDNNNKWQGNVTVNSECSLILLQ